MTQHFVPAWRDKKGNRLVFLAPNHVFDTWDDAFQYQVGDFIFYIPMGLTPAGIIEVELDNGKGGFLHVLCDGPMQSKVAVIEGPIFDEMVAMEKP